MIVVTGMEFMFIIEHQSNPSNAHVISECHNVINTLVATTTEVQVVTIR